MDIRYVPKYSHKSAGLVERYNGTLNGRIRRIAADTNRNWADVIDEAVDSINSCVHDVTQIPPKYAWEGRRSDGTQATNEELNEYYNEIYDKTKAVEKRVNEKQAHRIKRTQFKEGERVWLFDSKLDQRLDTKFQSRWIGTCQLTKQTSGHTWEIRLPDGRMQRRIYTDFLRKYPTEKAQESVLNRPTYHSPRLTVQEGM